MLNNLNCFTYFRQLTNLKKSLVMKNQNNNSALATLVSVFFFWGFIGASNGVFIPFCKEYFMTDQFQSQLVDFAFYGAYYIGALILFILSSSGFNKVNIASGKTSCLESSSLFK